MADGRERFIRQLESAAKRTDIMASDEVSTLFRRAALRLRTFEGTPLELDVDSGLAAVATELKVAKSDLIHRILREWLEQNAYLPMRVGDGLEADGRA